MIHSCTCKHEYQDSKYGPGNRVCNPCKKGSFCRCTVCGKEHQIKKSEEKENKEKK